MKMMEGKVALVTGTASGLGLATAKVFAQAGAAVAMADWHEEAVKNAAQNLAAAGYKTLAIRFDVSDATDETTILALRTIKPNFK